jgi:hypothetical protein
MRKNWFQTFTAFLVAIIFVTSTSDYTFAGLASAKRAMWLREATNPKQGRAIRGWLKQEANRQRAIKRSFKRGTRPPGGSRRIRNPRGYDAGHRIRGIHAAENLRPELASMNRARPGIARRLEKRLGIKIRHR